jgi:hypothetical protein
LLEQVATHLCPSVARAATDAALALLSALKATQLRLPLHTCEAAISRLQCSSQRLFVALQQGLAPAAPDSAPFRPVSPQTRRPRTSSSCCTSRHQQLAKLIGRLGFSAQDWHDAEANLTLRTAQALAPIRGSGSGPASAHQSPLDRLLLAAVSLPTWQAGSVEPSPLHATLRQLLSLLGSLPESPMEAAALGLSEQGWAACWMLEPQARGCSPSPRRECRARSCWRFTALQTDSAGCAA